MTTQAITHEVKVTGTGVTKGGKRFLTATPWFTSNYPLSVYLKDDMGVGLKQGDTITVEKGNLKDGKGGTYDSDWYWNLVESTQKPAPAAPKPQTAIDAIAKTEAEMRDPTRTSIERQTSLNDATDIFVAGITAGWIKADGVRVQAIIEMAQDFEYYLATGDVPMTSEEASNEGLPF